MTEDHNNAQEDCSGDELTTREKEVLAFLMQGYSNLEIAGRLAVSIKTVETHLTHIYRKLGTKNRTQSILLIMSDSHYDISP